MPISDFDPNSENCILPYCEKCSGVYKVFLVVVLIIIFYFLLMKGIYKDHHIIMNDPLNQQMFSIPKSLVPIFDNCCSVWPITHFILFTFLGILFPDCDILVIGAGILWEVFEGISATIAGTPRGILRDAAGGVEYFNSWWSGSFKDIIVNILGYYFGKTIYKVFKLKICVPYLNDKTKQCTCAKVDK